MAPYYQSQMDIDFVTLKHRYDLAMIELFKNQGGA